jgi:hypothetical protein
MGEVDLKRRIERLDVLADGLSKVVPHWRKVGTPSAEKERRAVQDAIAGAYAARVRWRGC